ncbi:hypothetical protein LTR94_021649 [Friedmanniomyces endolithicus]|nr:hypothetical protein LTR94_021649 [Friedmanniomyces endolithicus]
MSVILEKSTTSALVLFSGGQDSATCLAWALERFGRVETVGFDYGQRHVVEMEARQAVRAGMKTALPQWADRLGDDHVVDLTGYGRIAESALTADRKIEMDARGLPTTFVPGRNLIFLVAAAALADRRGLEVLVGGMCETDYSGYPDCRHETMEAMARALSLGLDKPVVIETPLMWLTKAQTWELADRIGGETLVELIIEDSHTCYQGDRTHRHAWGYGCGQCPACELRAAGHAEWGEGGQAGRPAVFLRFAGCNLWSGREQDRASAVCSFCDTDFVGVDGDGGGKFATADGLADHVAAMWRGRQGDPKLVVCTGGEPLLQLDAPLVAALHARGFEIAIESNGTLAAPDGIDWICVSPKADADVIQIKGQELKLVYPQPKAPPERFEHLAFERFWLQPLDGPDQAENTAAAIEYCLTHPQWRLSVQTHKYIGVR